MPFEHGLNPGDTIVNSKLTDIFKCSPQGGMRRAHRTNTLVIVSDHIRGIYEDRWIDNTLHYTGMGLEGDQRIDAAQNKTLAESGTNGVEVFLFEVFEAGNYIFRGQVGLADAPYQECMSSKGFGQVGHKNKRGFQIPNTFFQFVRQPLMSNYTSCVEASYFS